MNIDEKLDNFYSSAIDDATARSQSIVDEYNKSLKKIYEDHKEEALKQAEVTLRIETDNLIREKNKLLSTQAVEIRRDLNERNNQLIEKLFADVTTKLNEFILTDEYNELLVNQIQKASKFARGESITIYINTTDAAKKDMLEQRTGLELTVSNTDFFGGTRAVIHSKHILIDNSFVTRLAEIKDSFTL